LVQVCGHLRKRDPSHGAGKACGQKSVATRVPPIVVAYRGRLAVRLSKHRLFAVP
jgi:hypothetical protein